VNVCGQGLHSRFFVQQLTERDLQAELVLQFLRDLRQEQ
jgi:hypothetical protein